MAPPIGSVASGGVYALATGATPAIPPPPVGLTCARVFEPPIGITDGIIDGSGLELWSMCDA